jgi:hypothetical protein
MFAAFGSPGKEARPETPRPAMNPWRGGRRLAPAIACALTVPLLLVGCELAEVTIPAGEDLLIVESILDAGRGVQHLLLHRTLDGRLIGGEEGARVRVRRGDGLEVAFLPAPASDCAFVDPAYSVGPDSIDVRASCYRSPESAGEWVVPGERYELLIETVGGQHLHGRTTVPGHFTPLGLSPAAARPLGEVGECTMPADSTLTLHWSVAAGAEAYMTHMRVSGLWAALAASGIPNLPDVIELYGVSITERDTSIVAPTEVGVMEIGKYPIDLMLALRNGFPAGSRVRLTIGAMDRNYVTAVRGDNFNPSGLVRVSSIAGDGLGVFGSLVAYSFEVNVTGGGEGEGDAEGGGSACLEG